MNRMEQVLQDELNRLTDRLGGLVSRDTVAMLRARDPDLAERLDGSSAALAALRLDLVERYERWAEAIDECEALWNRAEAGAAAPPVIERRAA
jgi:hypothetical protein